MIVSFAALWSLCSGVKVRGEGVRSGGKVSRGCRYGIKHS
jgi:hypothetical protein